MADGKQNIIKAKTMIKTVIVILVSLEYIEPATNMTH